MIARGAAQPAPPSGLDLDAGLSRLGYATFRPGQREAVDTLLASGRLLLVAPTEFVAPTKAFADLQRLRAPRAPGHMLRKFSRQRTLRRPLQPGPADEIHFF